MLPLLREGMVLQLGAYDPARTRIGDVVVFRQGTTMIAHRVVGRLFGGLLTSGDNNPGTIERVAERDVAGTVIAVYAGDAPGAARIDDAAYHLRGAIYARTRRPRAAVRRAAFIARRGGELLPWRRQLRFRALCDAIGGYVRQHGAFVQRALEAVEPDALIAYAQRHSCSLMLTQAVELANDSPRARQIAGAMRGRARRSMAETLIRTHQIGTVITHLRSAGIPFILLKGAAGAYAGDPFAWAFPSYDIDILVPPTALNGALDALLLAGYTYTCDEARRARFLETHHHAAPLAPPGGRGAPIELHVALAQPGTLSTKTDWDALAPHVRHIDGPAGSVAVLDDFGTALHYAIHGYRFDRLRDLAYCARALRAMDAPGRSQLEALVARETRESVRLPGLLAQGARIAGIPWSVSPRVAAYLRWIECREDMPGEIGRRSQAIDAWFAAGRRFEAASPHVVSANATTPLHVAGRLALVPIAAAYAAMLRR